jgi:hypothetical protein
MDEPGAFSLGDFQINAAAEQIGAVVKNLAGMLAVTLYAVFQLGQAGDTVKIYYQTSFDQGQTWVDVACLVFTNAGGRMMCNLSGLDKLAAWTAPTDGTLADNTVIDGPLGDQMRAKVISAGVYGNTQVSVWAVAR